MSWKNFIEQEAQKEYYKNLKTFVDQAYEQEVVYPQKSEIYQALRLCPIENTKVVILGQDPYHGKGQANGLSFSVKEGMNIPPSLRNIFLEIKNDLGILPPLSGDLTRWAQQGVLLLNDVLTVREATPGSHQKKGWEAFTNAIIQKLSDEQEGIVFMLWGNYAQKKGAKIDQEKHLVLTSGHPSPMSANQGKWFGNQHFSKANAYLIEQKKQPIDW